jgi:hypothetical protein
MPGVGRDHGHDDSGLRAESVEKWSDFALLLSPVEIRPNKLSMPEIQPDGVANDLTREPVVFVEIGRLWGRHSSSTQGYYVMRRAYSPPEELRREHEYATWG